ncbi:hypothetical protein DFJ58DRAFT_727479 [Suillus subalutaceus]|uniref:uncharacterized protein n=1 Tax=Suillus subalutaceus TaxID=48586 RepID=UPI001B88265C|nr:uncharacterized protein DFJ58DRAFT_727479 [Suillus subalutaceus]KAG1855663.1 hypothetical protein DFJ58DRAFT_727479 [Suillus subalutaceus]
MWTATLLHTATPCACYHSYTYCTSSHSPPIPRKKTCRAGRCICAAHARTSLHPSAPLPSVHPLSLLTVDTPTPLPTTPAPTPLPSPDSEPLTEATLHPILQPIVSQILQEINEREDGLLARLIGEIKRLEKVILTGDLHCLQISWPDSYIEWLTGDSQYAKPP